MLHERQKTLASVLVVSIHACRTTVDAGNYICLAQSSARVSEIHMSVVRRGRRDPRSHTSSLSTGPRPSTYSSVRSGMTGREADPECRHHYNDSKEKFILLCDTFV